MEYSTYERVQGYIQGFWCENYKERITKKT
jgi:hypothetical protein